MPSESLGLIYSERAIGSIIAPTLAFAVAQRSLSVAVDGYIVNSITENKTRLNDWKIQVASEVKDTRGGAQWDAKAKFAISIGFRFNTNSGWHGYTPLDVENFLKPVVDALAAGLFCDNATDPRGISLWNYDDSNFDTLLIHRLPDAPRRDGEGVAICVSASG